MELRAVSKVKTGSYNQKQTENARFRRVCLVCSAEFIYRPAGKDKGKEEQRGLCCSMECKKTHIRSQRPPPFSRVFIASCKGCGTAMVTRTKKAYCGIKCAPAAPKLPPRPAMKRHCRLCNAEYLAENTGGMHKQYCSDECKNVVVSEAKRISSAANKAKRRSAAVEKVDPFKVFDRDGWKCKLCGVDTPRDKRGTHDSNAPELDHIIPIAKGGEHSYVNTQCSCRECNILKSDKILPNISSFASFLSNVAMGLPNSSPAMPG